MNLKLLRVETDCWEQLINMSAPLYIFVSTLSTKSKVYRGQRIISAQDPNHSLVFVSCRIEGVAQLCGLGNQPYVTVAAPESALKATSLQSGESLVEAEWVWCHWKYKQTSNGDNANSKLFQTLHLNKLRVFLSDVENVFSVIYNP